MAYVGTPIDTTNQFQSLVGKRFSGDASTTAFTLDVAPTSTLDIEVFVENVRQDPNSAYSLSGTTLTFAAAPPSGTNNIYVVHQAKAVGTISPAAGTVNADSFDNTVISGHTALAATPADTDEFLVSDAGTIKRIDYSHIKGLVRQVVSVTKTDTFSTSSNSYTDLTGLSLNITPSSTSSKILLTTQITFGGSQSMYGFARFVRGSTAIGIGDQGESSQQRASIPLDNPNVSHDIYKVRNSAAEFLDSPSSSSSLTYKIQVLIHDNSQTMYINRASNNDDAAYNGRYISSLTAMEILS